MSEEDPKSQDRSAAILPIAFALVLIPFLPLLCSIVECLIFGSNYVEDFFKTIGLFDLLGQFYQFIFSSFR